MPPQLTRNNHYVPVWYQKAFLCPGGSQYYYLDITPDQKALPTGHVVSSRALSKFGPKRCFCTFDLYTTQLGSTPNDEIERYLFGKIDDQGSKAVQAYIADDVTSMHDAFQDFFEYLDAQVLRTPKGLDWIRSRYPSLTQLELMLEMQSLRLMHCTMWAEGVREIVSAVTSDVKFIVTDHPVTFYNAAFPPSLNDPDPTSGPSIEQIGTQTIFALDADNCLILTHLEYAKNPDGANLKSSRTNARYRASSLVRTDGLIRKRKLASDEVIAINHVLKSNARRFIASANQDSLHPEKHITLAWPDISKVLLPHPDDLWNFGGEMYVGYEDGSSQYQDAYGRTSTAHRYLQKKRPSTNLGSNDPCGCGSGRKFKRCCKDIPESERPSWLIYGIRERNLMLCSAVEDILDLRNGKSWDDVRRELSDDHVRRIHQAVGAIWPIDTDLVEILPKPTEDVFRVIYLGAPDPSTMPKKIIGWLAYFDEMVIAHPFLNPLRVKPEFSPVQTPSQHKDQTLRNVLLLLMLEPYIEAGYIHLVPDPSDFSHEFAMTTMQMSKDRTRGWKPDQESADQLRGLHRDEYIGSLKRLSENSLRYQVQKQCPGMRIDQVDVIVKQMKAELLADPCTLLQPIVIGDAGVQLRTTKGYGLEVGMYLAMLTGSAICTDIKAIWQQLHEHTNASKWNEDDDVWQVVVNAVFANVFPIELDFEAAFFARKRGTGGEMRKILGKIKRATRDNTVAAKAEYLASEFKKVAKLTGTKMSPLTSTPGTKGRLEISISKGGFERNDIRRLLLTFGRSKVAQLVTLALFTET